MLETIFTQDFAVFFVVGAIGMLSHWLKRHLRRQTTSTLFEYLFVNHARYTWSAVMAYVGAVFALALGGMSDFGSTEALGLAWTTGYSVDSLVNKDNEATEEHEAAVESFE